MNKITRFLTVGLIPLLIIISFIYAYTFMHEAAHASIFSYFGCNSTIHITFFKGETIPGCDIESLPNEAKSLSALNEIIGYPCILILVVLLLIFMIMFSEYICKKQGELK